MKFLQILVLIFGLSIFGNAQHLSETGKEKTITLTGAVYDWNGAVVVNAKIVAYRRDNNAQFESKTNDSGIYEIELPFAVYKIEINSAGFRTSKIENYRIVDSTYGKMSMDLVLNVDTDNKHEPCGYSGANCLPTTPVYIKTTKVSNKILKRPLKKLPKKQNKINKE